MNQDGTMTQDEIEQLNHMTDGANWSLICFHPGNNTYKAYSQLDDDDALYKLIVIMREMILDVVTRMRALEGSGCSGSC
jgi:hypothetical protein